MGLLAFSCFWCYLLPCHLVLLLFLGVSRRKTQRCKDAKTRRRRMQDAGCNCGRARHKNTAAFVFLFVYSSARPSFSSVLWRAGRHPAGSFVLSFSRSLERRHRVVLFIELSLVSFVVLLSLIFARRPSRIVASALYSSSQAGPSPP